MADDPNQYWMGQEVPRLQAALGAARRDLERERFFSRLRQEDLKVHRETIEQQRGLITRLQEAIDRQDQTIRQLRGSLDTAEEARDAYFEAITTQKPDRQLVRENDDLARGILKLERDLKLTQEAQKRAEDRARYWWAEQKALQNAHNLAEMWRGRYEREKAATPESLGLAHRLPLAYFPAGEDPEARWGLTELGERALLAGAVKGPAWVLLVSPDPREVLSIEVRAGSRLETIYRTAGYVSADAATAGGNFLGLLEAFVEVAKGHDADLGRAMGYLESLHLFGQDETAAEALFEALHELRLEWKEGEQEEAVPASSSYDLAAVCARCGEEYREHLRGGLCGSPIPCDGFLAVAEAGAGLHFVCAACHQRLPLSDRAPSTMPLCGPCWRKEP